MGNIGFYGNGCRKQGNIQLQNPDECVILFDSGTGITFPGACCHTAVYGATGTGKTASVILPALSRLIASGKPGLIIDVKGNMGEQVRALAMEHGRLEDVVEFGNGPLATPVNLIGDMDLFEINMLIEAMALRHIHHESNNQDFLMKGVKIAADCGWFLRLLHARDHYFEPNLATVADMLQDPVRSANLFKYYKENFHNPANEEEARFFNNVECNRFHVMRDRGEKEKGRVDTTDDQQMNYNLHCVRMALNVFLDAPGIPDKFAARVDGGINMAGLLAANKLALIRFDLGTGPAGAMVAEIILRKFYAEVIKRGPESSGSFLCIDEFQEVADLSPNRLSDLSFISQAREFGCAMLVSTQSLSALLQRAPSMAAVDAFNNNCNSRIVFYSDDRAIDEMVCRYQPDMVLNQLQPGHAFVIRFDADRRGHVWGIETMNNAFNATQEILARNAPRLGAQPVPQTRPRRTLFAQHKKIEGWVAAHEAGKKRPRPERRFGGTWGDEDNRSTEELTREELEVVKSLRRNRAKNNKKEMNMEERYGLTDDVDSMIMAFPQLFARNTTICVPAGWRPHTLAILRMCADAGFNLKISELQPEGRRLKASSDSGGAYLKMLNYLLADTEHMCVVCGADCVRVEDFVADCFISHYPLCAGCRDKYRAPEDDAINPK